MKANNFKKSKLKILYDVLKIARALEQMTFLRAVSDEIIEAGFHGCTQKTIISLQLSVRSVPIFGAEKISRFQSHFQKKTLKINSKTHKKNFEKYKKIFLDFTAVVLARRENAVKPRWLLGFRAKNLKLIIEFGCHQYSKNPKYQSE